MYISLLTTTTDKKISNSLHMWLLKNGSSLPLPLKIFASEHLEYQDAIECFDTIIKSELHIVWNENKALDRTTLLCVLLAMLKQKPIIMLSPPTFNKNVDFFSKEATMNRLSKLIVSDIAILDQTDLNVLIKNVASQPVNYVLTKQEKILIKSHLRAYFRELLSKST